MEDAQQAVALAVARLARDLDCPATQIEVVAVEPVTWPNSALGCSEPGMMYMQVLTPGYRLRLRCNGEEHLLHTDRGRRVVRCLDGGTDGGATLL